MRTVHIGVGDYWDEVMVTRATQLLHKYQDLYLMKFFETKGIIEAVADFLLWVEARLSVADDVQTCQMSLVGRSHGDCLYQRGKGMSELKK